MHFFVIALQDESLPFPYCIAGKNLTHFNALLYCHAGKKVNFAILKKLKVVVFGTYDLLTDDDIFIL